MLQFKALNDAQIRLAKAKSLVLIGLGQRDQPTLDFLVLISQYRHITKARQANAALIDVRITFLQVLPSPIRFVSRYRHISIADAHFRPALASSRKRAMRPFPPYLESHC